MAETISFGETGSSETSKILKLVMGLCGACAVAVTGCSSISPNKISTATSVPTPTITATQTALPTPTSTATSTPPPTPTPLLPEEFRQSGYFQNLSVSDGRAIVDGRVWYVLEDGEWVEMYFLINELSEDEITTLRIESSGGVQYERLAGREGPEHNPMVVGIRGTIIRYYRQRINRELCVIADLLTSVGGEEAVLPLLIGTVADDIWTDGEDIGDVWLSSSLFPGLEGNHSDVFTVMANINLGDRVLVEVFSEPPSTMKDDWGKYPKTGKGFQWHNIFLHYDTYRSLMEKLVAGDISNLTKEESELVLSVFVISLEG